MTNLKAYGSYSNAENAWYKIKSNIGYNDWIDQEYVPETTLLHHTAIFDLVEKKDPGIIGFNPVGIDSPEWICIAVEKDGKFLVEKQLRYGKMQFCEEFPSGLVEKGEDPINAAQRELKEETGYNVDINDIKYLGKFDANPAFMSNYMHYFYINLDNAKFNVGKPKFDQHEKIESYWLDKNEVFEKYFKDQDSIFKAGMFLLLKKEGVI